MSLIYPKWILKPSKSYSITAANTSRLTNYAGKINAQLQAMLRLNKSRIDYAAKFEQLIADYNKGGKDVDTFFVELISFARSLSEEEQRGISENLSEEELAIFDLLIRPNIKLNKKEREQVKQVAKELLETLKAERIVLDWRKQQKTRGIRPCGDFRCAGTTA